MLSVTPIKALTLNYPAQKYRQPYLSAASGLVQVENLLYVVADDENYLGIFLRDSHENGDLKNLFPGDLPLEYEERKAEKPDLEVLTLIPHSTQHPHGALLALGSGSKKSRIKGVIISFNLQSQLQDDVEIVDLSRLYAHLKNKIGKLNIEGAVVVNESIILFQRGNKKNNVNASIQIPLKQFFYYINTSHEEPKHALDFTIRHYELGHIKGVPLCFTDATALPNGDIVFTATAENTSDAYLDGACMGSVIGIIKASGELHSVEGLDKIIKAEGIEANIIDNQVHLLLVTDADDPSVPAQLYSAVIQGYPFIKP
jgi:hypothetical protein